MKKYRIRFLSTLLVFLLLFMDLQIVFAKPLSEKEVTVDNLQPNSTLNYTEKKAPIAIDIQVFNDQSSESWDNIMAGFTNNVIPKLQTKGIDYKITYNRDPLSRGIPSIGGYPGSNGYVGLLFSDYKGDVYEKYGYNSAKKIGTHNFKMFGQTKGTNLIALTTDEKVYTRTGFQIGSSFSVVNGLSNISKVEAGVDFLIALDEYGNVYTWGGNFYGQIGDGTTNTRSTPYRVMGLPKIVDIAAGKETSIAVSEDGRVFAWGSDYYGQVTGSLYRPTFVIKTPTLVTNLYNVAKVASTNGTGIAVDKKGDVYTWGDSLYGQKGIFAPNGNNYAPAKNDDVNVKNIVEIQASQETILAKRSDGEYMYWGVSYVDSAGKRSYKAESSVTHTDWNTANPTKPIKAALAGFNIVALNKDGIVYLGGSTSTYVQSKPAKIITAENNTAYIDQSGELVTWGDGEYGVIGNGTPGRNSDNKIYVQPFASQPSFSDGSRLKDVVDFAYLYYSNAYAITKDGSLYEWGNATYSPNYPIRYYGDFTRPVKIKSVQNAAHVWASSFYINGRAYMTDTSGNLYAWGSGTGSSSPARFYGLTNIVSVGIGNNHTLASDTNGNVWVWGAHTYSTGDGTSSTTGSNITPKKLTTIANVVQVDAYNDTSLALTKDGKVYAWGMNDTYSYYNAFGQGTSGINYSTPTLISGLPTIKQISVGKMGAAAIDINGNVWVWGDYYYMNPSQTKIPDNLPYQLSSIKNAKTIEVGSQNVFVGLDSGIVMWGSNSASKTYGTNNWTNMTTGYYWVPISIFGPRKLLSENLSASSWRSGAEKYYVSFRDQHYPDFENDVYTKNFISGLVTSGISFVGMGDSNGEEIKDLINNLSGNGKFINYWSDPTTAMNKLGDYLANKQKLDLFINIGSTIHDDLDLIKQKVDTLVRPVLENYSIEPNIVITDGQRAPENRFYYLKSDKKIYYYDSISKTVKQLNNFVVDSSFISKSGFIYFLSGGKFYYHDPVHEKDVFVADAPSDLITGTTFVVNSLGDIYYIAKGIYWDNTKYIRKFNPKTGEISTYASNPTYIGPVKITADDRIYYSMENDNNNGVVVVPGHIPYVTDFHYSETGCMTMPGTYYPFLYHEGENCAPAFPGGFSTGNIIGAGYGKTAAYLMDTGFMNFHEPGIYVADDVTDTTTRIPMAQGNPLAYTDDGNLFYSGTDSRTGATGILYYNTKTKATTYIGDLGVQSALPQVNDVGTRRLKKYGMQEGINLQTFRPNSDSYYVYMNDGVISDLTSSTKIYDMTNVLDNNETSFIGMGTASNKGQIDSFVNGLGYGTYIDNTYLDSALTNLASYLTVHAGVRKTKPTGYVILERDPITGAYSSGEMQYTTDYSDRENDPLYDDRWRFDHNEMYYENNFGRILESGQYLSTPLKYLTKPGRYEITYQAQDNPKNDSRFDEYKKWSNEDSSKLIIYAHRRPIAKFTVKTTSSGDGFFYNIAINESSYDLDRQSQINQGISLKVWKWKALNDLEWTIGSPPSQLPANSTYLISLMVRDFDNAWSDELILPVTTNNMNQPPVASFFVNPNSVTLGQTFIIVDNSFDPDDDPIDQREWIVMKDALELYKGGVTPTISSITAAAASKGLSKLGSYTISLRVHDQPAKGIAMWSDTVQNVITVKNTPPVASVTFPSGTYANPTPFVTDRPTIVWNQSDTDPGTIFTAYEVYISNASGSFTYDSGIKNQNTSSTTNSFGVTQNMPRGEPLRVAVRVFDGADWSMSSWPPVSSFSGWKWMIGNRPPTGNLTWTSPIYQHDTPTFTVTQSDPDGNSLNIKVEASFNGGAYTNVINWSSVPSGQQKTFTYGPLDAGTYTFRLTLDDGLGGTFVQSYPITVLPLAINGNVSHTPEWDAYRLDWNQQGREPVHNLDDFWAGEEFVLAAEVTNTGTSTTKPTKVTSTLLETGDQVTLTSSNQIHFTGDLLNTNFIYSLADGQTITFRFQVAWSNGLVQNKDIPVHIKGNIYDVILPQLRQ